MPRRLFDKLDSWLSGVITSGESDQIPVGAAPRGRNCAFRSIGPTDTKIGFRKGAVPALDAPLTDTPKVLAGTFFERSDGTAYRVVVGDDGSLWVQNTDGSATLIDGAAFSDDARPGFAVANDFLFLLNGTDADAKKFDGTDITKFGIDAPPDAPVASAIAAGNMPEGTFDLLLTYYNSVSGTESPLGPTITVSVAAGEKLDVSWNAPVDPQVTHVRIYLRWQEAGDTFYRVIAGATPAPTDDEGGWPVAVTAAELDITAAIYSAFRIIAPGVNDNYPPPTGAKHPVGHKSRMFVHDRNAIYYSEAEDPENFNYQDRREPVYVGDGDEIVTIYSTDDVLLILKKRHVYALRGDTPSSWSIEEVSSSVGTDSAESVVTDSSGMTYWWDHAAGPVQWTGSGKPSPIAAPLIGPSIDATVLNQARLFEVVAAVDRSPSRQRVLFCVPEFGSERNNLILPFNYRLRRWEAEFWNPFDVSAVWTADDANGQEWLYMGGYAGHVWQFWSGNNDGVPTGEARSGQVVSSTDTTLTVTVTDENGDQVSPAWTVDALSELYVYAINQDKTDVQRRRIVSNTADTLTIAVEWGLNPNDTYTFAIGAAQFELDTPWLHNDLPFNKKRYEFFFLEVSSPHSGVLVLVDLFFTYDLLNVVKDKSFTLLGSVLYDADSSIYDVSRYATTVLEGRRFRVGTTGKAWRARIRALQPDVDLTLLKIQMQSVLQNTHR